MQNTGGQSKIQDPASRIQDREGRWAMKRAIGWIVAVIFLIAVGFRLFQAGQRRVVGQQRAKLQSSANPVPVRTATPRIGAISSILSYVGTVRGEDQVEVFSEAPGRLLRYTVKEGDGVSKNQLLALVDRAVTGMDFEPLKVRSPISGTVGRLLLDRGSAIGPQVPVAVVVRMDRVKVLFTVEEKELAKVKTGMKAEIRVDTYSGEVFVGKLTSISPIVDPRTRSASCEVTLKNRDHRLKPGMFAEIELLLETRDSAVLIQRDAVVEDLIESKSHVFVVEEDTCAKREVEIGLAHGDTVEILSGIEEGQVVVVKGQHYLKGGERVEIVR